MKKQVILDLAILASVVFASGKLMAQNAPGQKTIMIAPELFGDSGQFVISSDAAMSAQRETTRGVSGGTTTIQLSPALDYFAVQGYSFGGFLGASYTHSGNNHSTRLSIGPRVGYSLILSDLLSLWPKIGVSYGWTSVTLGQQLETTQSSSARDSAVALNIFVPFVFHPVNHFFVGFGPFLDTDLKGNARTTLWGGKLNIGGWL